MSVSRAVSGRVRDRLAVAFGALTLLLAACTPTEGGGAGESSAPTREADSAPSVTEPANSGQPDGFYDY